MLDIPTGIIATGDVENAIDLLRWVSLAGKITG